MAKRFGWQTLDRGNAERAGAKGATTKKLEAKGLGGDNLALLQLKVQACKLHPEEQGRIIEHREKGEHLRLLARAEPECECYAVQWKGI